MAFQMLQPGVRTYACGREVCEDSAAGKREYNRRIEAMRQRQGERCAWGEYLAEGAATFEHEQSRGGGKRDDRIEVDGEWRNAAACRAHNNAKGSRRYAWQGGKYLPVESTKAAISGDL